MFLRIPKYRLHKGSGQALVQINGKRIYLGKHGSTASKENYRRIIAELCVSQDNPTGTSPERGADGPPASINELILAFWPHVEQRYVKNGSPTSEQKSFKTALLPLRELFGSKRVTDFGPLALIACRQQLIDKGTRRPGVVEHRSGLGPTLHAGARQIGSTSRSTSRSDQVLRWLFWLGQRPVGGGIGGRLMVDYAGLAGTCFRLR